MRHIMPDPFRLHIHVLPQSAIQHES
uniref:Uncharacterized protein n=1 Tax=Rhizophora mucronata TaxID=61149 RepID=A0A2P2MAQ8_RHIMU